MYVTTFLLLVVSRGRSYYVAPAYAMLLAAGAVWLEGWLGNRTPAVRRIAVGLVCVFVVLGAAAGVALVKPVAPINSALWNITAEMGDTLREMVGWPDMAEQVAKIYATIPEDEKPRTVILAGQLRRGRCARSLRAGVRLATASSAAETACGRGATVIRRRRRPSSSGSTAPTPDVSSNRVTPPGL